MIDADKKSTSRLMQLWRLGCSLKLAIALASTATLLIMGGSLVMHFNPAIFAGMEEAIMSDWLPQAWSRAPWLVFWVPLSGLSIVLFGINTLCCLIDWLLKFKSRWRKTGEYLIHAGFVLLVIAYIWGNTSGFRSGPHRLFPGERMAIPNMPGYSLLLEDFTPQLEPTGRPLDMLNQLSLWENDKQATAALVRINHPLMFDGLVILPTSFGQELDGFRFHMRGRGFVELSTRNRLSVSPGVFLVMHKLLPDARQSRQGTVVQTGSRIGNPAMLVSLQNQSGKLWEGWYFLREPLPEALRNAGLSIRPTEPLFRSFSLLTINRDPGDKMAMTGGLCISLGVLLAFFSFYRKRAQGDRPEV